jgi:hypothetical protein
MTTSKWFDDLPVLAPEQVAAKLREAGENDAAGALEMTEKCCRHLKNEVLAVQDKSWQQTTHAFGIGPGVAGRRAAFAQQ